MSVTDLVDNLDKKIKKIFNLRTHVYFTLEFMFRITKKN